MKRGFALLILVAMMLTVLNGCETPPDPDVLYEETISEALQEEIYDKAMAQNMIFYWEQQPKPYLGTVNGCMILSYRTWDITFDIYQKVIADCKFEWMGQFGLYAYRDGEICTLQDAYEKGWLEKRHIEQICARHVEIHQNWTQYYLAWKYIQNQPDSRNPNILYTDHLSSERKAMIYGDFLYKHQKVVKWDYVDPYYGTINGCSIFIIHPLFAAIPKPWSQEIAGYTFEWDNPIDLYVYRKGVPREACDLKEAYEKGWLTEEQIGIIYEKHNEYRQDFPNLLDQWQATQEETVVT